ncbi:MAG: anthranilate phosphoribosyltransferase [Telluria sp.]
MQRDILKNLSARQELSPEEIYSFIAAVARDEVSDAVIGAFLMGLLSKGVSTAETVAIARAMNTSCVPLRPRVMDPLLDTCGTGGGLSTFNISTAAAVVCAAAGIRVAKHGSRSLSSLSGSADVLEAMGVLIDLPAPAVEQMIEEIGIGFIHAPNFNPVMRRLLTVEAALGIKTIFYSLIGPLINPAGASRHLLGVYRADWQQKTAEVVRELGAARGMVVHGLDGVDEISLLGPTRIYDLGPDGTSVYDITPEDFGMTRCRIEAIRTLGPRGNAELIQSVFSNQLRGAPRDAIILNSSAALIIGGRAANFREGIALAEELIEAGAVSRKLNEMVDASHGFGDHNPFWLVEKKRPLHTAERIWHGILSASPDGYLLLGRDGLVELANAQACSQLGLDSSQVVNRPYAQLLDAAIGESRLCRIDQASSSGKALRWKDALGVNHYGMTAIPIDDGSGVVLISHDRSEYLRVAASEQDKRARLKTLIEALPDLVWLSDPGGNFLNCNTKFERLLGLPESQIKGRSLTDVLPTEFALTLSSVATRVLECNISLLSRGWLTYSDDGRTEFVEVILAPFIDQGVVKGVMGIGRDVTEFKTNEDELRLQKAALHNMLYTDELTRLPSRQAQIERIQELAACGSSFSIICISLNNFSRIYTNFGAALSDAVIAATGAALLEVIPSRADLYRSSDIRFCVIVGDIIDPAVLSNIAHRIIGRMSTPLKIADASIFINVSIGVASYPTYCDNIDQLISNSMIALNEAEKTDGTSFRIFDPRMLEGVQHLQWLDYNVRLALDTNQFELHYQPKVNVADTTVSSVEALIRWVHPERGNIRPDEFIGRCESNGLIIPLGRWIIDAAAKQAMEWSDLGRPVRVAINVSARQFADAELLPRLRAAQIRARGLLDIELTESCFMGHQDDIFDLIQDLRGLHFGVHLDDFGTGYSSLAALAKLPLTLVKLDKAFIQEIGKSGNGQALLELMIGMVKGLGLPIVAEGVETQEQYSFLKNEGVDLAQGWLFAAAMDAKKFEIWRLTMAASHYD